MYEQAAIGKKRNIFYGYIVVAAALLITTISHGAQYTFGIFFKPLLEQFGWTKAATSAAFSLYLVLYGLLGIFVGRLNDRFGPRLVVTICAFFLGLGYILMSRVSAIWHLYLFYGVLIGVGMSGIWVPLISTMPRWFILRRGLMTGIVTSGSGIGTILLSLVAGSLITKYQWRLSYIMVGVGVLVILVLAAQFLRRDPKQMGLLPYNGDAIKAESPGYIGEGVCFRKAVKTSQFWMLCAIFFCFGFDLYTVMVHIVAHAIELGIPALNAASIIAIVGGVNAASRIGTGNAGDRIGNIRCLTISFVLMTAALFLLTVASDMWQLSLFGVFFGLGYGGLAAMMSPVPAELFGLKSIGTIVGAVMCSFTLGGAIGPVLAGRISDITGSYHLAFLACAVVSVMGTILCVLIRPAGKTGGCASERNH
jgi:MFS family permease